MNDAVPLPSLCTFPFHCAHHRYTRTHTVRNKRHETFRNICVSLAQKMHTAEISLRTNILGEPARQNIRPLSETKAIENGANTLAETFLFAIAALLIVGESYRSSSKQSKQRDDVDEKLEGLLSAVERLQEGKMEVEGALERTSEEMERERKRREALEKVVERLVWAGASTGSGWDTLVWEGTPLKSPRVEMVRTADAQQPSADPPSSSSSKS
ncbi:optic atrophy 3 protein-domain-containing protein [Boletus edulis BED1]|uniref:Optic atrophy 3 protein-domain-containing protein n=1 Tax=Boletus edulis BED1 TaxID=1328754 RepID=A0AAD4BQQ5_BOLED|nr:optic atrophy 3 protein-domain-containing protein [Boletus edulis BED1]